MAERDTPRRRPQDIGKDSPATGEAKRQSITGGKGGPRSAKVHGKGKQPPQSSGRRARRHEQASRTAKSFTPEESPVEQGEGERSPERLKARSRLQGLEPRSGSHRAQGERTEEIAVEGPPAHGRTPREGRQHGRPPKH
jgi:hypothetical protein